MNFLKNKSRLNILAHLLNVSALVGVCLLFVACNESGGETIAQPSNVNSWSEESGTGTVFSSASNVTPLSTSSLSPGELIDSRDGQIYKTISIGEHTWMIENLNYNVDDSFCFDNVDSNCTGYGRLYTWSAALNACPSGWHLPTKTEWEDFFSSAYFSNAYIPSDYRDGLGYRDNKGNYEGLCDGFLWSSTERSNYYAYYTHWNFCDADPLELGFYRKDFGFSVRCIKSTSPSSQTSSSTEKVPSPAIEDTLIDVRDGQIYRTVKIGNLVWMGENLNYKMDKSLCYDNQERYCVVYGRLYTWAAALTACPSGWHLPDSVEWNSLIAASGMSGYALMSSFRWNGSDDYLFSAFPAGYGFGYGGVNNYFMGEGHETYFWSSTTTLEERTRIRSLDLPGLWWELKDSNNVNSVRCVRNELLTDLRDGQTYRTVKIGTQEWMAENLNYKVDSSFCYNDSAKYCEKYGRLYTWNSAATICPIGWHLPDTTEWRTLINAVAGGNCSFSCSGPISALKSMSGWNSGNGTDDFGFSALPAGNRTYINFEYSYINEGKNAYFWSSTENGSYRAYSLNLSDYFFFDVGYKDESFSSVRCIKGEKISSSSSQIVESSSSVDVYIYSKDCPRFYCGVSECFSSRNGCGRECVEKVLREGGSSACYSIGDGGLALKSLVAQCGCSVTATDYGLISPY